VNRLVEFVRALHGGLFAPIWGIIWIILIPGDWGCATSSSAVGSDEYESKAYVEQAETEREIRAFRSRLDRMRDEMAAKESQQGFASQGADTASVSESRTAQGVFEPVAKLLDRTPGVVTNSPNPVLFGEAPDTPERLIRASQCLLASDIDRLRDAFRSQRGRSGAQSERVSGGIAHQVLEAEQLLEELSQELTHRRLAGATSTDECAEPARRRHVAFVRGRLKTGGHSTDAVPMHRAGLAELRALLEEKAGLPSAEANRLPEDVPLKAHRRRGMGP
jgi:hypothetical protein